MSSLFFVSDGSRIRHWHCREDQKAVSGYFLEPLFSIVFDVFDPSRWLPCRFGDALQNGLLEIISPPPSFYPDLNELRVTLNDPIERVKWRTKQNLDYAFLMMYAQSRGVYYVQLEDDILTTPGYVTKMKKFALKKDSLNLDWFLLDFCQLGFIGTLKQSLCY